MEQVYSVPQTAEMLGHTIGYVRQMIRTGRLQAVIDRSSNLRYLVLESSIMSVQAQREQTKVKKDWIYRTTAARLIGCDVYSVEHLCATGKLESFRSKVGNRLRINRDSVDHYLGQQ